MALRANLLIFLLLTISFSYSEPSRTGDEALARLAFMKAKSAFFRHLVLERLPVVADVRSPDVVPFWPDVRKDLQESLEYAAGDDARVLQGLVALHEGRIADALVPLETAWSSQGWQEEGELTAAQAYFQTLAWLRRDVRLQSAWKLWENKYLSPSVLLLGIESYDRTQSNLVDPLLKQAIALYPNDRRFLGELTLQARFFPQISSLWRFSVDAHENWSQRALTSLLLRVNALPDADRTGIWKILMESGALGDAAVTDLLANDYAMSLLRWSKQGMTPPLPDGVFVWDEDGDGWPDSRLTFAKGQLVSWATGYPGEDTGFWEADYDAGKLSRVRETQGQETWSLFYQDYPFVSQLSWEKADRKIVYTFQPFVTKAEPFVAEKLKNIPAALWPAALSTSWKPLDPAVLVPQALRVQEYKAGLLIRRLFLIHGEVWLAIEDTNGDGKPDTWSYYRNGRLASVYRNYGASDLPDLHEIYSQGRLIAVEAAPARNGKTEYVLYPQEGVELWDWNGTGTPLLRVFRWSGEAGLKAAVFSRSEIPILDMPAWKAPPWR